MDIEIAPRNRWSDVLHKLLWKKYHVGVAVGWFKVLSLCEQRIFKFSHVATVFVLALVGLPHEHAADAIRGFGLERLYFKLEFNLPSPLCRVFDSAVNKC